MYSENWIYFPENDMSKSARELLNKFAIVRNNIDIYQFEPQSTYQCYKCAKHGNHQQYPTETMLSVEYKRKDGLSVWHRYCKEHASLFKSHAERVGGHNF